MTTVASLLLHFSKAPVGATAGSHFISIKERLSFTGTGLESSIESKNETNMTLSMVSNLEASTEVNHIDKKTVNIQIILETEICQS